MFFSINIPALEIKQYLKICKAEIFKNKKNIFILELVVIFFLLICIKISNASSVILYTKDNAPATPTLEDLPLQSSVSKDGITWTFSEPERVGQFVNGDYYVIGPVTITAIDPMPANGRNGSVLNLPPVTNRSGFDSRVLYDRYDPSLRSDPPIHMKPGDSLVSTISVDNVGDIKRVLYLRDATRSPVKTASILTCMESPVPPDAFRPSYCDVNNIIYLSHNLHREILPNLKPVSSTPQLSEFEGYFRRPWIDTLQFELDFPVEYMPDYGREIARAVSMASLLLMLNFTPQEKEPLLIYLIQYGIDLYGCIRAGYPGWRAHGGHGVGRKLPIVLAGVLLNDTEMQSPNANFSEDMQTMYDQCWTGANVIFAGHFGAAGHPKYPDWGKYEHLQPKDWPGRTGEDYRRCCTSLSWVGQALSMRLIKAEKIWNHPAFFDYVDRWMFEDDSEFVDVIQEQRGWNYHEEWQRQGQAWDAFVEEMWDEYRYISVNKLEAPRNLQIIEIK